MHQTPCVFLSCVMLLLTVVAVVVVSATIPRNLPLGKTIEYLPEKSMFLSSVHGGAITTTTTPSGPRNQRVGGSVWPVSVFWTTIYVGTPLRPYAVTIDSGSSALYILGQDCKGCPGGGGGINHIYRPNESSTSHGPIGAGFNASYLTCNPVDPKQRCSIGGSTYLDMATISADDKPVMVKLGAIQNQTSNFYQFKTVEGVMGMVGNGESTLFYQQCIKRGNCGTTTTRRGDPPPSSSSVSSTWGICMHEGSKSNGTLTVGGVDEFLASGPIQYVPSSNKTFVHIINVHHMMVGGVKVPIESSGVLDTGTNDILLPGPAFNHTRGIVCASGGGGARRKHCSEFFDNSSFCAPLTDAEVDAYPDISFQLDRNVTLILTAKDYLLKGSPAATAADQYCFGLSDGGSGFAQFIIGDTLMRNYYLVFKENEVGWGPVNKETCGSQ